MDPVLLQTHWVQMGIAHVVLSRELVLVQRQHLFQLSFNLYIKTWINETLCCLFSSQTKHLKLFPLKCCIFSYILAGIYVPEFYSHFMLPFNKDFKSRDPLGGKSKSIGFDEKIKQNILTPVKY